MFFGKCEQAKCRRKGVRPPFHWAVPHLPCLSLSFQFIVDLAERMNHPSFIIPARAQAPGLAARRWLPYPMGHTMALRILRRVVQEAGLSESQAAGLSYNTCRRFLPTVANVFQVDRSSAQALGSWVEELSGTASSSAPVHMSVHYSDQKALASGLVKHRVLQELFQALEHLPGAKAIIQGGSDLLPVGSVSWDVLAGLHRDHVAVGMPKDLSPGPIKERKRKKDPQDKTTKRTKKDKHDKKAKKHKKDTHDKTD